jgi:hypothetical protein
MTKAFTIGCSIILLLVIIESIFSYSQSFLPIGGSSISQIGVILGICVVVSQIQDVLKEWGNDSKK